MAKITKVSISLLRRGRWIPDAAALILMQKLSSEDWAKVRGIQLVAVTLSTIACDFATDFLWVTASRVEDLDAPGAWCSRGALVPLQVAVAMGYYRFVWQAAA